MSNGMKNVIVFTIGAALGSVVTWKLVKTTYEQIAQDEIDSVKEAYKQAAEEALSILEEADAAQQEYEAGVTDTKPDMTTYITNMKNINTNKPKPKAVDETDRPYAYVISPDEFGEIDDYETISLTFYADGILTDVMDEIVEDVEGMVGEASLDTFGEYEDDAVFVRNDILKCDYEILADERNYADVDH